MKCKFCEAELEEDAKICPSCGAELETEVPAEETAELTETAQEAETAEAAAETTEETTEEATEEATEETTEGATEEGTEETAEEAPAQKKAKKKVSWQTIVAIVACVVALICLAIALLSAFGLNIFNLLKKEETEEEPANVGSFVSEVDYTGTDKEAKKAADKVVATMNGAELTNGQLQIYYGMLVEEFLTNYYQYLEQLGLDLTMDLNTQACYFDDTMSWEAYFVTNAINNWKNYQIVAMQAEEESFVLSDAMEEALGKMPEELQKMAEESGFETADELISERMGGYCTLEDYLDYSRVYYTGAEYTSVLPSEEELSTYFDGLSEMFSEYGITKESGPIVDVRHILFQPDGGTTSEDGTTTTYSEEEWAACLEAAEAVYKEWKEGEATEDSFAALANTHSADPGSNTNGGLYTQITSETTFVEPFLTWCMDANRKVGDTDIVKTEHGYHIMYFSASEPVWLYYAKSQYISDRTAELMETGAEKWPAEINHDKICLKTIDVA